MSFGGVCAASSNSPPQNLSPLSYASLPPPPKISLTVASPSVENTSEENDELSNNDRILLKYPGRKSGTAISPVEPVRPPIMTSITPLDATVIHKTEETMIEMKEELRQIRCAVTEASLLGPTLAASPPKEEFQWEKNSNQDLEESIAQLRTLLKETVEEVGNLKAKLSEIQSLVQTSARDTKTYMESAFFREDSELLKKIHDAVTTLGTNSTPLQTRSHLGPQQNGPVVPERNITWAAGNVGTGRRTHNPNPRDTRNSGNRNRTGNRNPGGTRSNRNTEHRNTEQRTTGPTRKVALITDSIMKSANPGTLGRGYNCHVIHRRSWDTATGLKRQETLEELREFNPEAVCIHLGINDVRNGTTRSDDNSEATVQLAKEFLNEVSALLPECKITISLPTLTRQYEMNGDIIAFREKLREMAKAVNIPYDNNKNFRAHHLSGDGIHPTNPGASILLGNFRYSTHKLLSQSRSNGQQPETTSPAQTDQRSNSHGQITASQSVSGAPASQTEEHTGTNSTPTNDE